MASAAPGDPARTAGLKSGRWARPGYRRNRPRAITACAAIAVPGCTARRSYSTAPDLVERIKAATLKADDARALMAKHGTNQHSGPDIVRSSDYGNSRTYVVGRLKREAAKACFLRHHCVL